MCPGTGNIIDPEGRAGADEQGIVGVAALRGQYGPTAVLDIDNLVIEKTNIPASQPGTDVSGNAVLCFFFR